MGGAVPLNVAQQAVWTQTAALPNFETQALSVTLLNAPELLQNIARAIQLEGVVLAFDESGQVTLRTMAGTFDVSISAMQGKPEPIIKQMVAELLSPVQEKASPITLTLRPTEEEKAQAFLIVPKGEAKPELSSPSPKAVETPLVSVKLNKDSPFAEGKPLAVTVLPEELEPNLLKSDKSFLPMMQETKIGWEGTPLSQIATMQRATESEPPSPLELLIRQAFSGEQTDIAEETAALLPIPTEKEAETLALAAKGALEKTTTPLTMGEDVKLRVDLVLPENTPLPRSLGPEQVVAVVAGKTPTNHIVLHTQTGKALFVHAEGELPLGTTLILTPLPEDTSAIYTIPLSREQELASMRELVAALASVDPQAAQNFIQDKLPTPAHHLSGTLLFLLSALQGGKLDEWLGSRTLTALERMNRKPLIDAALKDLNDASGLVHDSRIGEWKAWAIPMHHGQSYQMLQLFVRKEKEEKSDLSPPVKNKTHFLITMNMSGLGAMQLDGLSQRRRLDLVVRSERALPAPLPTDLRATYIKTLDALNLVGTITFQTGRQNWITFGKPTEESAWMV